jgi:hypothetical protein
MDPTRNQVTGAPRPVHMPKRIAYGTEESPGQNLTEVRRMRMEVIRLAITQPTLLRPVRALNLTSRTRGVNDGDNEVVYGGEEPRIFECSTQG